MSGRPSREVMQIPAVASSFPTAAWPLSTVDLVSDAFDPARALASATPKAFSSQIASLETTTEWVRSTSSGKATGPAPGPLAITPLSSRAVDVDSPPDAMAPEPILTANLRDWRVVYRGIEHPDPSSAQPSTPADAGTRGARRAPGPRA